MKRMILTLAVLCSCLVAAAQVPAVCESGLKRITHSKEVPGGSILRQITPKLAIYALIFAEIPQVPDTQTPPKG